MNTENFKNRIVLVSGGNAGIGAACAEKFAALGARVIIAARREQESLAVVKKITAQGGEAHFIQTDVGDETSIQHLFQRIRQEFKRLDFAINNAGMSGTAGIPVEDMPLEEWQQVLNVNLTSVFRFMQEEIKLMKPEHFGVIVNISSVAGIWGGSLNAAYTASKHGVVGLTKIAAKKCAPLGIRINALCPGITDTPLAEETNLLSTQIISRIPAGRAGKPIEIAEAAAWLCSENSGFVIGSAITIDGGFLA